MDKTDEEVLELCKSWFEDIMERCDRLTSGNVSHGSRAIHAVAKNYAEYVDEYLHNRWKPNDKQLNALHDAAMYVDKSMFPYKRTLMKLYKLLEKLKEE